MSVTSYEYAKLSQVSYDTPKLKEKDFGFTAPDGWSAVEVSSDKNEKDGFFAVAFKKDNEIVVALRGTDFHLGEGFNNIISDLPEIVTFLKGLKNDFDMWSGDINDQFNEVKPFITKIMSEHAGSNITFTGHSLGGAIAQVASVAYSKHATVFDSPGIVGVKVDDINLADVKNFDITIFNAAPDLMNTVNKHVVKPVSLNVNSKITGPELIDYIKFSFEQHPMDAIINSFDSKTGEVKAGQLLKMESEWPNGAVESYQFYASYDNRPDVWNKYIKEFWNNNIQIAVISGKEVHVQESFASFDHFKESFIRRELISENNNPLKIIQEEVGQLLSGKEGFNDSDLILGLKELGKVINGDLDLRDAVRTKSFGEIVLKYTFNVFVLEAFPMLERKLKQIKDEISEKIDAVEKTFSELGDDIKDVFSSIFADKKTNIIDTKIIGDIDLNIEN